MFLGQDVHYSMVYITYSTELNLQISNYAQIRSTCRENSKYALDEIFMANLALAEWLPPCLQDIISKVRGKS